MAHLCCATGHPVPLLNLNIASTVCQSLDRRSLPSLARTAKFLLDPALNELWREIESLNSLLFPFKASFKVPGKRPGFSKLPYAPTPDQWDRFNFYARRVRVLHVLGREKHELSFLVLSSQRPVLPHLKSLIVSGWFEPKTVCTLSIFFTPSLHQFKIDYQGHIPLLEPLIATLAVTIPTLHHVEILKDLENVHEFGHSITHFQNLSSIDVPLTDSQAHSVLSHLSTLPSLSSVKFDISTSATFSRTGSIYTFPAARDLSIRSHRSETEPINLLAITRFDHLSNLEIGCGSFRKSGNSLFEIISTNCGQSLKQIHITDGFCRNPCVRALILEPLFRFTNLCHLSLKNQFYPTNEVIESATKSWPNLTSFRLLSSQLEKGRLSPLKLTGLLFLITECKNLVDISIAIAATNLPKFDGGPISRPGLVIEICCFYSTMDDPAARLANFFSSMLPDARIEIDGCYCEKENPCLWEKMVILWKYFVKARQEERERAAKQVQELQMALDQALLKNTHRQKGDQARLRKGVDLKAEVA